MQLWGIPGVQKEAVLAASARSSPSSGSSTSSSRGPAACVIPGWAIDAVAEAPGGSQPSYALGLTRRDNDFYREWDEISRDRERFTAWMRRARARRGGPG